MDTFNWKCFRALIKATGRSLDDLAKDMGVTKQTISGWKSGRTIPSLNNLSLIAKFFKIQMEDLMFEPDFQAFEDGSTEPVEGTI